MSSSSPLPITQQIIILRNQSPQRRLDILTNLLQVGMTEDALDQLLDAKMDDGSPLFRNLPGYPENDTVIGRLLLAWKSYCGRAMPAGTLDFGSMARYLWEATEGQSQYRNREQVAHDVFSASCFSAFLVERVLAHLEGTLEEDYEGPIIPLNDAMRKWPTEMFWLSQHLSPRLRDGLAYIYVRRMAQAWQPIRAALHATLSPNLVRYVLRAT